MMENPDIKNFFENKLCGDMVEYMGEFLKPHKLTLLPPWP